MIRRLGVVTEIVIDSTATSYLEKMTLKTNGMPSWSKTSNKSMQHQRNNTHKYITEVIETGYIMVPFTVFREFISKDNLTQLKSVLAMQLYHRYYTLSGAVTEI